MTGGDVQKFAGSPALAGADKLIRRGHKQETERRRDVIKLPIGRHGACRAGDKVGETDFLALAEPRRQLIKQPGFHVFFDRQVRQIIHVRGETGRDVGLKPGHTGRHALRVKLGVVDDGNFVPRALRVVFLDKAEQRIIRVVRRKRQSDHTAAVGQRPQHRTA